MTPLNTDNDALECELNKKIAEYMHELDVVLESKNTEAVTTTVEKGLAGKSPVQWWHDDMQSLALQLSAGVLKEMRNRIMKSSIQKEKLVLDENTQRMRDFFTREIARYVKRITGVNARKQVVQECESDVKKLQEEIVHLKNIIERQMLMLRAAVEKYGNKK